MSNFALKFNGSSQYVTIPFDAAFNQTPFTCEAWVTLSGTDGSFYGTSSVGQGDNGGWNIGAVGGTGWLGAPFVNAEPVGTVPTDGGWHHVAVTDDGTTFTLFYDGVVIGTMEPPGPQVQSSTPFTIGATPHTDPSSVGLASVFTNGTIDEVRFSSVVRDVAGEWSDGPPPPFEVDGDTVALWHFDEGTGTTTADASGNGHDGTLVGSPQWVEGMVPDAPDTSSDSSSSSNPGTSSSSSISQSSATSDSALSASSGSSQSANGMPWVVAIAGTVRRRWEVDTTI